MNYLSKSQMYSVSDLRVLLKGISRIKKIFIIKTELSRTLLHPHTVTVLKYELGLITP